jgi:hypothetical protein
MAVASVVFALRARSIAFFTAARSPESGEASALADGAATGRADSRSSAATCFACPAFSCAALRWCRAPLASCGFPACGDLWSARAMAAVEHTASKAEIRKQDSGRERWFIP